MSRFAHFHYFSHKLRRCLTLSLTVRLQFIIWHLSNGCVEKVVRLSSGGGAGCLIMSIKQERGRRLRARPPPKNNANQVRTAPACSTRHGRKARLVHPSIHFLYPLNLSVGSRGGWSLSQRSSGERRGNGDYHVL